MHCATIFFAAFFLSVTVGPPHDSSCGPRAAQYLLEHHGASVTLGELRREMESATKPGTSFVDIMQALERRSLSMSAVQFEAVRDLAPYCPCIVHTDKRTNESSFGHFLVVLQADGPFVKTWDGLQGVCYLASESFNSDLSKTALIVAEDKDVSFTAVARPTLYINAAVILGSILALLFVGALHLRRFYFVSSH